MQRIIFFSLVLLLFSCEFPIRNQNHDIPRFSVDPLENSGIKVVSSTRVQNNLHPSFLVLFPSLIIQAIAQERIDCNDVHKEAQDARHDVYSSGVEFGDVSPIKLVRMFYTEAISQDCLTRLFSQEASIEDSDQSNSNGVIVPVLTVEDIDPFEPENKTFFISWTDDPTSQNVKGKLVNKLSTNGILTKTRIDLDISNGKRFIKVAFKFDDKIMAVKGISTVYEKSLFKEIAGSAGNIREHYVSGQYLYFRDRELNSINEFVKIQSSIKKNKGTSIFRTVIKCNHATTLNEIESDSNDCDKIISSHYYESSGSEITASEASSLGLKMNNMGLLPVGLFFEGQTESSFYRPVLQL